MSGFKETRLNPLVGINLIRAILKLSGMRGLSILIRYPAQIYSWVMRTDLPLKSGRKIVSILEHNPDKDPGQYDSDELQHMRRVVAYCKRHLAQEETAKRNTNSKSYKSLKNWGHDPLKT